MGKFAHCQIALRRNPSGPDRGGAGWALEAGYTGRASRAGSSAGADGANWARDSHRTDGTYRTYYTCDAIGTGGERVSFRGAKSNYDRFKAAALG